MFRLLLFIGFLSTISSVIADNSKDKDSSSALIAYAASVQENVQNKLLNGTALGAQRCSATTICPDGQHCCSTTTCCPNNRYCCGGGRMCCATGNTSRFEPTVGLLVAALLFFIGTPMLQK